MPRWAWLAAIITLWAVAFLLTVTVLTMWIVGVWTGDLNWGATGFILCIPIFAAVGLAAGLPLYMPEKEK